MTSNISKKISNAFKSFSQLFEVDENENELLQSEVEEGEIEKAAEDEAVRSNNGGLERQNAGELSGTNVQQMIEREKATKTREPSVFDEIQGDLKAEKNWAKGQ